MQNCKVILTLCTSMLISYKLCILPLKAFSLWQTECCIGRGTVTECFCIYLFIFFASELLASRSMKRQNPFQAFVLCNKNQQNWMKSEADEVVILWFSHSRRFHFNEGEIHNLVFTPVFAAEQWTQIIYFIIYINFKCNVFGHFNMQHP